MGIGTINLGRTLRRTANKYPERLALVSHEGEKLSYSQLERLSNRFANALLKLGFVKGDHIATLFRNCSEQVIAMFGILKAGCIALPLNVRLSGSEIRWVIDHSDSTGLIFSEEFEKMTSLFRSECKGIKHYVMAGGEAPTDAHGFEVLLGQGGEEDPGVEVFGEDEAFLIYTAGTTGKPKGVLLTHNGCLWNCVNWYNARVYRENDRSIQVLPLYHVAALGSLLTYVYIGGTCYLKKTFDARDILETIQRERITRWMAAPTVFNMILEIPEIEKYDKSSLTLIGSGGAIMPSATHQRLLKVFTSAQFFDTFGMTEASGGVTTLTPDCSSRKVGSVGKAYIGSEIRVVDQNERDAAAGEIGEIVFRGNNLMKGYYKDPEATEEALRGGWMHTGDLGCLDEEGFLYIVDRKKDLIITGGENVYPGEVEDILFSHPKISEAAVIGIPDRIWGEAIKAVIVIKSGQKATEREIIEFCRERIAGFKCPKSVDFLQALPKSAAGKILRKDIRDLYKK